jgi:hypothetical protein
MTTKNPPDEKAMHAAADAYRAGASLREIADSLIEMGYTGTRGGTLHPYAVALELRKLGVKIRPNARPEEFIALVLRMSRAGAKQVEIAEKLGCSQPTVSLIVRTLRAEGKL